MMTVQEILRGLDEFRVTPYRDPVPSDYVISRQSMESLIADVQAVERERIEHDPRVRKALEEIFETVSHQVHDDLLAAIRGNNA